VAEILDDDGIWVFEQSYLPAMLATHSYDTICHEHLEYYGLRQIAFLAEQTGLKIVDVEFNDANGGSFCVTAAKEKSRRAAARQQVNRILEEERELGLDTTAPFQKLQLTMEAHRKQLRDVLQELRAAGKAVLGYGASTKGNVLLQYCGIGPELLPAIVEVNEDKFGSYTPGSGIPIISDRDVMISPPDYFLVLPWHFRAGILEREKRFLSGGGAFIFPLPELEVVTAGAPVLTNVPR
jgi:hypothetical protein